MAQTKRTETRGFYPLIKSSNKIFRNVGTYKRQ